jgi:CIC family chloride channel protein
VLVAYAALGAITGLVSTLFIRAIYGFEHFFENHVKGGYYGQHVGGMLIVGLMLYALMSRFGHYYVEGVGYATIQDVLTGMQLPLHLLILLFVCKLLATSLTLGSGASGGVFSPALFLGAITGAAYGVALHRLFPSLDISTPAFAVVGMGGVVGGATGAAMAAIVMIFEMTLDYTVIVPMTLTVAISYAVRKSLMSDSIYTRKLVLRGEAVPDTLRADLYLTRAAASIMNSHVEILQAATRFRDLTSTGKETYIVTEESGAVAGAITGESLAALDHAQSTAMVGDVVQRDFVVVAPVDTFSEVVGRMRLGNASFALVASHDGSLLAADVQGVITRKDVIDTLARDMELFGI